MTTTTMLVVENFAAFFVTEFSFYKAYTTSSDKREEKQNPICDTVTLPGVEGRLEKGVRGPCSTTSSFDILSGVKPPASNNPKKRKKKKGIESLPMYIS